MLYLNPSSAAFRIDRNEEIFVDKSMLISEVSKVIGKRSNFLCVSRPRRFGKSMAGNMIVAYYSKGAGRAEDFEGLKIASDPSFDKWRGKLNVIKLDLMASLQMKNSAPNLIQMIESDIVAEICMEFPTAGISGDMRVAEAILRANAATGELFAIIIDEYDVLVREEGLPSNLLPDYLSFLTSLFKNGYVRPAIAFAYLTGIMPIMRDKIQSKLNEFSEFSMLNPGRLAPFVGFTTAEVQDLCRQYDMDFDECRRWYDGYHAAGELGVYSPKSVVESMLHHEFSSYWNVTGSFEALRDFIDMNFEGVKDDVAIMIGGGRVKVDVSGFQNNFRAVEHKDDVFTYLIHIGYLAYDRANQECFIPNKEVRMEWVNSLKRSSNGRYSLLVERINDSKELLERTIAQDEEYVAASLDKAHEQVANPLIYNKEYAMQCAIGLAYFYADAYYTIVKELPTGKGYADMVFIPYVPNVPALIVELKRNQSSDVALRQIDARDYADRLRHYHGNLLFVGVNYDEDSKRHTCKIQKMEV